MSPVRARADRLAIIEVEDDGIGIPAEERESIFERFYRVLGTDAEGSGLGLPIAAEIAELHQARIDLLSGSDGRGSLFRVSFPRVRRPKKMLHRKHSARGQRLPDRPLAVSFASGSPADNAVHLGAIGAG
jgi:K+-sensing histidine kinase KdpD